MITEDQIERALVAFEALANKPPVVVVQSRSTEESVKGEPKTADGKTFRHALKSGGWLIEYMLSGNQVAFIHEDKDGNRHRLVFAE